ncbi:phosphatase PAP2 family protein [Kineococcus sp. SYSU DK001]|uniref:phosphatase PAP2 family protein n=1 Tax=Kineococcus sp. SYSU DK001 TaxID=3383122 RepID=UPI003D7D0B23
MPSAPPPAGAGTPRWAHLAGELLAPWVLAAVMPPLVCALTTVPAWRGALHGLAVTVLCAVVPHAVVARGVRRGRYASMHVPRRQDRPPLLAMVVGLTVLTGALLRALGAPTAPLVLLGLMTGCAAVGLLVSKSWKISLHALTVAASAVVLTGLAPAAAPALLAVPWVAAARVRVGAHTPAQVVAGALVGAVLAVGALALAG